MFPDARIYPVPGRLPTVRHCYVLGTGATSVPPVRVRYLAKGFYQVPEASTPKT